MIAELSLGLVGGASGVERGGVGRGDCKGDKGFRMGQRDQGRGWIFP